MNPNSRADPVKTHHLKFESFEPRILLSAAAELVPPPPETREVGTNLHLDTNTNPSVRFAELGAFKQSPPQTAQTEILDTSTQHPSYMGFAATHPLSQADANIFNNASGSATEEPSQPSTVSPDPIPLNKLNSSVWGDWMPSYQSKLRTTEQTQISIGTSLVGHSTSTGGGTNSSPSIQSSLPEQSPGHEKSRPDLSKLTDKTPPTAFEKRKPDAPNGPSMKDSSISRHWQKKFITESRAAAGLSTQIRIELATDLSTEHSSIKNGNSTAGTKT